MNARTNHVTKIRRTCMAILIKEGAIYDSNIKNKKKVFCHLVNHTLGKRYEVKQHILGICMQ